jgi:hypothetical protein
VIDALAPNLEQADALAARLEALDEVGDALTLTSFIPEAQEEKLELIDSLAFYLGPALAPSEATETPAPQERRKAYAELRAALEDAPAVGPGAARLAAALAELGQDPSDVALAELEARLTGTLPGLLERLRQALDAGPVGLEDLPVSVRDQWVNERGEARVLIRPAMPIADNADLAAFARAVLAMAPHATGTPIVVMAGGQEVVQAFRQASLLALTLIAILLALLLGLGVSGGLHVVMRWREEGGVAALAATSTPRAVLFSALTTVASFGSLAVSNHRGLASMGLLLTIAISWSLVCSLLILPHLLAVASPRRAGKG